MNRYMHPANQSMHRARQNSRMRDIQESQILLLELVTTEPTILQSFKIIESICLSQGIFCRIQGAEVSKPFQRFLDDHYLPFCRAAIRAMFTYGFVPWRTRRLGKGDEVPEVLPPGTFSWHTEVGPEEQARAPHSGHHHQHHQKKRRRSEPSEQPIGLDDDDSRLVIYRITPSAGGVREEDVSIYISTPPALDVSANSCLYATVPSPLSYLLTDYKNLREAQKRRSHADAWNTTARIVSTFKPSLRQVSSWFFFGFCYFVGGVGLEALSLPACPAGGQSVAVPDGLCARGPLRPARHRGEHVPQHPGPQRVAAGARHAPPDHGDALQPPPRGLRASQGPRRRASDAAGPLRGPGLPPRQVPARRLLAHRYILLLLPFFFLPAG